MPNMKANQNALGGFFFLPFYCAAARRLRPNPRNAAIKSLAVLAFWWIKSSVVGDKKASATIVSTCSTEERTLYQQHLQVRVPFPEAPAKSPGDQRRTPQETRDH